MRLLLTLLALTSSLAFADPGTLISSRRTAVLAPADIGRVSGGRFRNNGSSMPAARYTVNAYLLEFESLDLDDQPVTVTAQVFVPRLETERVPLFVFGAGSTGLVERCAPSYDYVNSGGWETYTAYTLAYAGQGFISVIPNYMGFFDVGTLQPYFSRVAEGRVMLDAARAVNSLLEGEAVSANGVFFGGYSQGGHAAFAAADLWNDYAPEVDARGVVGFGATTGLEALFEEFTYVAPWVVHAYDTFFNDRFDPADILAEPYLSRLENDAERFCVLGVQNYYPSSPQRLFTPAFADALADDSLAETYPDIFALFSENDAGLSGHGLPAIMLQGVNDPVVPLETQNVFVAALCDLGSRVRYPNYLRTRHETRYIGFTEATTWMEALTGGEEAPSDCELVSTE